MWVWMCRRRELYVTVLYLNVYTQNLEKRIYKLFSVNIYRNGGKDKNSFTG
jgi:hypothetical protein